MNLESARSTPEVKVTGDSELGLFMSGANTLSRRNVSGFQPKIKVNRTRHLVLREIRVTRAQFRFSEARSHCAVKFCTLCESGAINVPSLSGLFKWCTCICFLENFSPTAGRTESDKNTNTLKTCSLRTRCKYQTVNRTPQRIGVTFSLNNTLMKHPCLNKFFQNFQKGTACIVCVCPRGFAEGHTWNAP